MDTPDDAKDVGRLRMTMARTPTIKRLDTMRDNPQDFEVEVPHPSQEDRTLSMQPDPAYLDYMLQPREVFARAYAQYIANRSDDDTLKAELRDRQEKDANENSYPQTWTDEEFAPIADDFDRMFEDLGWAGSQDAEVSAAQREEITDLLEAGWKDEQLGRRYGVSVGYIHSLGGG
jgi:hypothetical protein